MMKISKENWRPYHLGILVYSYPSQEDLKGELKDPFMINAYEDAGVE